jgi:1-acyl-sn-glycerol-3-phosphate acyltransferase
MSRVGMIPINRKSGRKALESLKKAGKLIRERDEFSIAVLPEGTRTLNGKLSKFKKGGFLLAIESGLDILPVIQVGSFKIKRKGKKLIKPGRVKLVFESPISVKGYTRKNIDELMNRVRTTFGKYLE